MIQEYGTKFYDRGRMHELDSLEELYEQDGFKLAVIYGRRRVGKTSLISEFIKRGSKKSIEFIATENTDLVNRESFSECVFEAYSGSSEFGTFSTWEKAFRYVAKEADGEKIVIKMDEYRILQSLIRLSLRRSKNVSRKKAAMFSEREIHYYLFSKSGFTESLKKEAKKDDKLTLTGLNDLFNV